jgi:acetylornithine deacetylase/succinyl-diaminopimelate desuccinylase-like protein
MEGGRVYGRGAIDMKGSLACQVEVARVLIESGVRLKGDLWLTAVVGHEVADGWPDKRYPTPGEGALKIAEAMARGEIGGEAVVITEGFLDRLAIVHKGMGIYTAEVLGAEVAHHTASMPLQQIPDARNPAVWVAELILELTRYNDQLNVEELHPLLPSDSLNIGMVRGGDYFNRVPIHCMVRGTRRWNPGITVEDVERDFDERLNSLRRMAQGRVSFRVRVDQVKPPMEVSEDEEIVRCAKRASELVIGDAPSPFGMMGAGDAGIFMETARVPSFYYGPFTVEEVKDAAHSDREYITIKNMGLASKALLAMALDFCGQV